MDLIVKTIAGTAEHCQSSGRIGGFCSRLRRCCGQRSIGALIASFPPYDPVTLNLSGYPIRQDRGECFCAFAPAVLTKSLSTS